MTGRRVLNVMIDIAPHLTLSEHGTAVVFGADAQYGCQQQSQKRKSSHSVYSFLVLIDVAKLQLFSKPPKETAKFRLDIFKEVNEIMNGRENFASGRENFVNGREN
jgi:hypothetical protein